MLDTMRKGAGRWFVKIFLGLLVLSFAVWGIGDIFRISPDTAVATVGGTEISQAEFTTSFNQSLRRLQQRFGGNIDSEQARQFGLVDQTLSQMVRRALYDEATRELGLAVSDDTIRDEITANRAFHDQFGRFDKTAFEQRLYQNGMNEQIYVAQRRLEITRQQLFDSTTAGSRIPDKLVQSLYRYQNQRRVGEVVTLRFKDIKISETPNSVTLAAYHKDHATRYTAPEFRALAFVWIRAEDLLDEVSVDPAEVREAYDSRLAEFTIAETREIEQILVPEKALAEKIAKRLAEGSDFATVAKQLANQDAARIKMGTLTAEDLANLPAGVSDAVFALAKNAASKPLESPFGWHVFRATKITPGRQQSFADKKAEIDRELRLERAGDALIDLTKLIEDSLAGGEPLEGLAAAFRLRLVKLDAVSATGRGPDNKRIETLPRVPSFLSTAFQTEERAEPALKEARDGSYFLVRVDKITPPALRAFETVRAKVLSDWQTAERKDAGEAQALALADKARGGTSLAVLAKSGNNKYFETAPLTRRETGAKAGFGQALVEAFFSLKSGAVATGLSQGGDAQVIVRIKTVTAADLVAKSKEIKDLAGTLRTAMVGDILDQFAKALEASLDVEVNERAANAIFDQGSQRNF